MSFFHQTQGVGCKVCNEISTDPGLNKLKRTTIIYDHANLSYMNPISRKKFILSLTFLFLLLLLSIFYYRYKSQFNYDVINLENRSGIHLIDGQPAIKEFYATNRLIEDGNKTGELSPTLNYGISIVNIPRQYRIGGDFKKKIVQDIPLEEKKFFHELNQTIAKTESKLLVVWIHGYANSFEGTAAVLARGAYDLNTEATYLFFSWPSQNRLFAYVADEQMEKKSAVAFANFLTELKREVPGARLVIIGHSLGTRLLCDAFDILYTKADWRDKDKEISDVILIAPDVDQDDFDLHFKDQILAMVKRLTVYVASDDGALLISNLKHGTKPLGLPTHFDDNTQLDETQALLSLSEQGMDNLDIVDATYIIKPSFSHSYYRSRDIISDIYWLLNHNAPTDKRQLFRSKLRKKDNYWVIPP
ncbi:alpha/beta hydrolase [uncultured Legionella sp.]|uniref:alpha/beta hydrolase n=1 Tax=uncultured Legionella sp. TaxID=210934 RepID=UPI002615E861|nr:alpha/beta hydrolase [uncultured Legionella sp.]